MLRSALVVLASFAMLSLLGARTAVSVLSGTVSSHGQLLLGLAYTASYFAALLLVPPLLLTALFRLVRLRRSTQPPSGA